MRQPSRDSGFTLIEVLVAVALTGAMMAIAVGAYGRWANAAGQSSSARELQTLLRSTQQRAVTEGVAMCVDFDTTRDQYTVFRGACDDPARTKVQGPIGVNRGVQIVSPSFGDNTGVTFRARGMATEGSVQLARDDSSAIDTLHVSRLTGYVELDD